MEKGKESRVRIWGTDEYIDCRKCPHYKCCDLQCVDKTTLKNTGELVHICGLDSSVIVSETGDSEKHEGVYTARCKLCGREWNGRISYYP